MAYLNDFRLIGRIVKDIEVKTVKSGSVANFTLVNTDKRKGADITQYYNCTAWGDSADRLAQMCGRGTEIYFEGKHQTNEWVDKYEQKRKDVSYFMTKFILLSNGKQNSPSYPQSQGEWRGSNQSF